MAPDPTNTPWHPRFNPFLIAASFMLATFMEVLDTSVANVSLPHIAGSLSASNDEATWVLTSYLVSNAIVLPMTGWLGMRFGRKRFLTICIALFTAASALCGAANNLPVLIVSRILQGAAGGALQPMSQAILIESFPPEKRGQGMAIFAMGVVVAPILGPTLGGWITDNYSWRWIFYINVPIGIIATWMISMFVEDPPYLKRTRGGVDYIGFWPRAEPPRRGGLRGRAIRRTPYEDHQRAQPHRHGLCDDDLVGFPARGNHPADRDARAVAPRRVGRGLDHVDFCSAFRDHVGRPEG
jgi:MFS transporter, DHA2 family, multidrug resistance protein